MRVRWWVKRRLEYPPSPSLIPGQMQTPNKQLQPSAVYWFYSAVGKRSTAVKLKELIVGRQTRVTGSCFNNSRLATANTAHAAANQCPQTQTCTLQPQLSFCSCKNRRPFWSGKINFARTILPPGFVATNIYSCKSEHLKALTPPSL